MGADEWRQGRAEAVKLVRRRLNVPNRRGTAPARDRYSTLVVRVEDIAVGARHRRDLGDLTGLRESNR